MRKILLCLVFVLAGCASTPPPCPKTGLLGGVSHVTMFYPMADKTSENIVSRAAIRDFKGSCGYKKGNLSVELDVSIFAELGAAGEAAPKQKMQHYPYFIAILDPEENIIARRAFVAEVAFEDERRVSGTVESLYQTIPMKNPADAKRYKILFGFQLTEEQIQYNRNRHQS